MNRVMLIDDDPAHNRLLARWLEHAGMETTVCSDGAAGLEALAEQLPSVVLLDLELGDLHGLEVLRRIKWMTPEIPVVMLTADRDVSTVVDAMQAGAWDYLAKPVQRQRLLATVRNAAQHNELQGRVRRLEREVRGGGFEGLLGTSPVMTRLFDQLDRVGPSELTVLVQGESGSGKELVARALHRSSARADGPFVALNCAAIPENLQEAELFGHEKGAFTGATHRRAGRFEQANGGTLFLDEVGELSPGLQAKLLRVLQERSFHRVGGTEEIRVDIRLLAATHKDLSEKVASGDFRQDLFFRLAVYELAVPPLRERGDDIVGLAQHFLSQACARSDRPAPQLSEACRRVLKEYDWPGNVRELLNAMERGAIVCQGPLFEVDDLPPRIRGGGAPKPAPTAPEPTIQLSGMAAIERAAIVDAMARANGNLSQVMRTLNIPRTTFYRKLKRYGLR